MQQFFTTEDTESEKCRFIVCIAGDPPGRPYRSLLLRSLHYLVGQRTETNAIRGRRPCYSCGILHNGTFG